MSWWLELLVIMVPFFVLVAFGLPMGFAFGVVSLVMFYFFLGPTFLFVVPQITHNMLNNYGFLCIPLFILMAALLNYTGINDDLYTMFHMWFGRIRGGLALSTVLASAGFAAASGGSAINAMAMGQIAVPSMLKRGYHKGFATGVVAAGGTLGPLIPPSLGAVFYGILTETSINRLFMAGLVPGLILAGLYAIFVLVYAYFKPDVAPPYPHVATLRARLASLNRSWGIILVVVGVLGSIYFGIATATEAAAVGVFCVMIIALVRRRLKMNALSNALLDAALMAGVTTLLLVGAKTFTALMATLKVTEAMTQALVAADLSPTLFIVVLTAIYFVLGCVMDNASLMFLTVPLFFPLAVALELDPVWFGIFVILNAEIGTLTPPVGVNVILLKAVCEPYGVKMSEIYRGIIPYVPILLFLIVLIVLYPQLALWLPDHMYTLPSR